MAQNSENCSNGLGCTPKNIREAVCIDTRRIYDACSDKDCIQALQVYFTSKDQATIDAASSIKVKSAEVLGAYFDTEPVAFNNGFYSVDITFFFRIKVAAYQNPAAPPTMVYGLSVFTKKVILFGSDAPAKVFTENKQIIDSEYTKPDVNIEVVDPMVLAFKYTDVPDNQNEQNFIPPAGIAALFDSSFEGVIPKKIITVDLGLFSIVQMIRNVQVMVPIYGFCIPDKQCEPITPVEDPCELFSKICFPTEDFFPPKLGEKCE